MSAPSPLVLLPGATSVAIAGQVVLLTSAEYAVLDTLAKGAGEVVPSTRILAALYGDRPQPPSNGLQVLVSRLRKKLVAARAAAAGVRLLTRRGLGYQLVVIQGGAA